MSNVARETIGKAGGETAPKTLGNVRKCTGALGTHQKFAKKLAENGQGGPRESGRGAVPETSGKCEDLYRNPRKAAKR